jgi:hypothetical protein
MNFEQNSGTEELDSPEVQERLANEYLEAYDAYKKIADQRSNDLRILDKLREEEAPREMIDEQQSLYQSVRDAEEIALQRYSSIGEKLTAETEEKYLTIQD